VVCVQALELSNMGRSLPQPRHDRNSPFGLMGCFTSLAMTGMFVMTAAGNRHCERSEAIYALSRHTWIAALRSQWQESEPCR